MTKNTHALSLRALAALAATLLLLVAVIAMLASCACSKEEPKPESSSTPMVVADKPKPVSSEPVSSEPEPEAFWMLILGLDSREGTVDPYDGTLPYSDTIMLVRVDPATYKIGIVSIPRDTATFFDEALRKINDGYHYYEAPGAKWVVQNLTGVEPKYYISCTLAQYVHFLDAIGGTDVDLPQYISFKDIMSGNTLELNAGPQHVDGPHALVASRVRKAYPNDGEAYRQEISRQIVCNVIRQVAADPATAAANLDILLANSSTDIPADEFAKLVLDFSAHADQISFVTGTGPYWGGIDPRNEKWLIPEAFDTYAEIVKRIENHEEWQDLVPNVF